MSVKSLASRTRLSGRSARIAAYVAWVLVSFALATIIVTLAILGLQAANILDVFERGSTQANVAVVAIGVVTYALMLAIVLYGPRVLARRKQSVSLKLLGLDRMLLWREIPIAVLAMGFYFILAMIMVGIASQLPWVDVQQTQDVGLDTLQPGKEILLAFLLLVVIGPVIEEVIFRGYLYGKIRATRTPWWLATLITSIVFGAVHLQWNVAFDTFALSVVMCLTREVSGSIWPSILMHMMKNGMAFYFLFIAPNALGM